MGAGLGLCPPLRLLNKNSNTSIVFNHLVADSKSPSFDIDSTIGNVNKTTLKYVLCGDLNVEATDYIITHSTSRNVTYQNTPTRKNRNDPKKSKVLDYVISSDYIPIRNNEVKVIDSNEDGHWYSYHNAIDFQSI